MLGFDSESGRLWACNFTLQLAKALTTENDYAGALRLLESGSRLAAAMNQPQLEVSSLWVYFVDSDPCSVL